MDLAEYSKPSICLELLIDDVAFARTKQPSSRRLWHEHARQTIVVIGAMHAQPAALAAVCDALDVAVVVAGSSHEVPRALHQHHPIAVICATHQDGDPVGRDLCKSLRSIGAYDPDMPVMIVTIDEPVGLGTVDAAEQLWGLTGLQCIATPPAPHDIVTFLFQAGRRRNTGRLMPVS